MTGYKAYRYALALKLHFTTDKFNVFENKGNVRGSFETFQARNDRHLFDKLARRFNTDKDLIQFIVSQYVYNNPNFIYELEQAEDTYTQWIKVKESITRTFQDDLNELLLEHEKNGYTLDEIFNCTTSDFPLIIKLYLGKRINPQTISILSELNDSIKEWFNNPSLSLVLENEIRILFKMKGFFKYDRDKITKIFNEFYANFDVGLYK